MTYNNEISWVKKQSSHEAKSAGTGLTAPRKLTCYKTATNNEVDKTEHHYFPLEKIILTVGHSCRATTFPWCSGYHIRSHTCGAGLTYRIKRNFLLISLKNNTDLNSFSPASFRFQLESRSPQTHRNSPT